MVRNPPTRQRGLCLASQDGIRCVRR